MPRISEFYGIFIYMYFQDHGPAHFHAIYGEAEAQVEIETGHIRRGRLPPSAQRLVLDWLRLHRIELLDDWRRAQAGLPLNPIPPLE